MSNWWVESPEANRVLAEERAVVKAAELVSTCIEKRGILRKVLAKKLGVKPSELSQRLSGRRNLTLRSLAAMVHELDYELELSIRPVESGKRPSIVTTQRRSDWPEPSMRYTSSGVAMRGINGAA